MPGYFPKPGHESFRVLSNSLFMHHTLFDAIFAELLKASLNKPLLTDSIHPAIFSSLPLLPLSYAEQIFSSVLCSQALPIFSPVSAIYDIFMHLKQHIKYH
jgi:hypothetical protein